MTAERLAARRAAEVHDAPPAEAAVTAGTTVSRDGTLFGHAAQRVTLACAHGSSTFFLLPGRDPSADVAALHILWVRHTGRHGCGCIRTGPGGPVS